VSVVSATITLKSVGRFDAAIESRVSMVACRMFHETYSVYLLLRSLPQVTSTVAVLILWCELTGITSDRIMVGNDAYDVCTFIARRMRLI
jgi:hypothetical protein